MFSFLTPALTYGFAAAVSPGPLSLYLISQAVTVGWRRALPVAFSPLVSDGPVALLVLAVLSQAPSGAVQYLRFLGGVFILYLAFGAWKAWRSFDSGSEVPVESKPKNNLWKAAVVNWLNPNPYIGWSVILGPMILTGWRYSPGRGMALILGFYMMMIGTMIGMAVVFAAARTFGSKVRKNLVGLSSIGLACLGLYQLWLGFSAAGAASWFSM